MQAATQNKSIVLTSNSTQRQQTRSIMMQSRQKMLYTSLRWQSLSKQPEGKHSDLVYASQA